MVNAKEDSDNSWGNTEQQLWRTFLSNGKFIFPEATTVTTCQVYSTGDKTNESSSEDERGSLNAPSDSQKPPYSYGPEGP